MLSVSRTQSKVQLFVLVCVCVALVHACHAMHPAESGFSVWQVPVLFSTPLLLFMALILLLFFLLSLCAWKRKEQGVVGLRGKMSYYQVLV